MLGYFISFDGIKVEPTKIEVMFKILVPKTQKEVHSFLGHVGYYRRFIEKNSRIPYHLFSLLIKDVEFVWIGK